MAGKKKVGLFVTIGVIVAALAALGWFSAVMFEGEKPLISAGPLPAYLSTARTFKVRISDRKRGLKVLKIEVQQGGREVPLMEKGFPFEGLLNKAGVHEYETEFTMDPGHLNLAQGRFDLLIQVRDYSRRRGGDGNLSLYRHKMILDTIPPAIRAVTRMNYVNVGGAGLIVYQTSSDTVETGVFVDQLFFKGYPAGGISQEGFHVCYFGVPYDAGATPGLFLWAKDRAGNVSKTGFSHHIRRKRFRRERINISDRFLARVLPYFSFYSCDPGAPNIDKFLEINGKMREENARTYCALRTETVPDRLWEGPWLRLKNAATMARFADDRSYYYKGEKVDEKIHLGVDLASLANSEVPAGNKGRVVFRDRLGIYGNTVVLDHGQGIASIYAHLSKFNVEPGQEVAKGETIGFTGETGLAGGDHLHFAMLVGGVFVNPLEWWDSHWIEDNITRKLALAK